MPQGSRYCPLCQQTTDQQTCPNDGAWTIAPTPVAEVDEGTLKHATIIAGRYVVEKKLGRGSSGTVYLARDHDSQQRVAVKTLLPELVSQLKLVKRFFREAKAMQALDHAHIVDVLAFGVDEVSQQPFIALEYLDGPTLEDLLASGPMPERTACFLLAQIAEALAAAHSHMVVHRDLKPDNIRIVRGEDGKALVKVLDFGVAKLLDEPTSMAALTASGAVLGTPLYMSPEQSLGKKVTPAADLYSLGCILHEMCTGEPPVTGDDAVQILVAKIKHPTPPLPETLVDGAAPSLGLQEVHAALLHREPEDRPRSAADLVPFLYALARGEEPPSLASGHAEDDDEPAPKRESTQGKMQAVQVQQEDEAAAGWWARVRKWWGSE